MEFAEKTKERSTVILAVLTLLVIGLSLLISTLQTFRHQREAEEQHLFLTSRAVLLSIENSVRRGPVREDVNRLSPNTADFFQELEQDGDVLFVGIIDEDGGKMLTSPLRGNAPIELPEAIIGDMMRRGEWHGRLAFGDRAAYIYGKRLVPLRGIHPSLRDDFGPPGFLVVGVDMDKYLSAYTGFRKNVIFQALYILAAAITTWGLGVSFLSRREQARKVVALELFQAKLLDNLPDGLITIDTEGIVRSANPAALDIIRRTSRDVLGRPVSGLPEQLASRALRQETQTAPGWRHIDHEGKHLEVLALPISNDRENALLLILRDRTQLYELEKNLAGAEKLAAVGTLAAGVAHEVRNPLSSLRGFAQYFVKKLAGCMPEEEYAKTMVREADRLNRVITDLLFLARPKPVTPQKVEISPLVRDIAALMRFDLEKKGVALEACLDEPVVFADKDGLKQALLNLVLNSLDALGRENGASTQTRSSETGNLRPADTRHIAPASTTGQGMPASCGKADDDRVIRILSGRTTNGFRPGTWIAVRDHGHGMTRRQKDKAFEAFFTDKEHGTGLGLALIQRIMLDHGGSASISSEPGKGCTVRLDFPDMDENFSLLPAVLANAPDEAKNASEIARPGMGELQAVSARPDRKSSASRKPRTTGDKRPPTGK